jgi:antitoxin component YwqK of YwqJK toxin-antitoxin module
MKLLLTAVSLLIMITSCKQSTPSTEVVATFDTTGYTIQDIPGTNAQWAVKMDASGNRLDEGTIVNGQKEGTWIEYHTTGGFPSKSVNYLNGILNGPYIEYTNRGQISLKAFYKNNKLDGPWAKYNYGYLEKEANYENGLLNGTLREYDTNNRNLQREINYKDGKQHGLYRFYNADGEVTLEYEYNEGEKISGGMTQ